MVLKAARCRCIAACPSAAFTNIFRTEYSVINLGRIAELHEELGNAELTLEAFAAKGLLKKRSGLVKVLGDGELTVAVTVHAHKFSKSARKRSRKPVARLFWSPKRVAP